MSTLLVLSFEFFQLCNFQILLFQCHIMLPKANLWPIHSSKPFIERSIVERTFAQLKWCNILCKVQWVVQTVNESTLLFPQLLHKLDKHTFLCTVCEQSVCWSGWCQPLSTVLFCTQWCQLHATGTGAPFCQPKLEEHSCGKLNEFV